MSPRVLIADQLSPAAVSIFKERGLATDVKVGLAKEELEKIIGDYDGLAVRSATKVTEKMIAAASKLRWSAAPASASTTSTSRPRPPRASSS